MRRRSHERHVRESHVRESLDRTRTRGTELWLFAVGGQDQRRFVAYVLGRDLLVAPE